MKFFQKIKYFQKSEDILFSCNFCGECCKGMDIPLTSFDIKRILSLDNIPNPDFFITLYPSNKENSYALLMYGDYHTLYLSMSLSENHCIFLKDNKCTIYENRPSPCRTWPFTLEKNAILKISETSKEMVNQFCDKKKFENKLEISDLIKKGIEEVKEELLLVSEWNMLVKNNIDKQSFEEFIDFIRSEK